MRTRTLEEEGRKIGGQEARRTGGQKDRRECSSSFLDCLYITSHREEEEEEEEEEAEKAS